MKRLTVILIAVLCTLLIAAGVTLVLTHKDQPKTEQPKEKYTDVAVLSTTDMHGKCWDTNLLTQSAEKKICCVFPLP